MIWVGYYGVDWLKTETIGDSGFNLSRGWTISWMDRSTSSSKFSTRIGSLVYEGAFLEAGLLGNAGITFNPPSLLMYYLVCLLNWSTSLNGTSYKHSDSSSP